MISVDITALKAIAVTNINLEGCFDSAIATPAPTTIILLGSALLCLAGFKRRLGKRVDGIY